MSNLILTICSNRKSPNSEAQKYDVNAPKITYDLPDIGQRLFDARKQAFHCIKRKRKGSASKESPLNKLLRMGPDIVPDSEEPRGRYMPALKRYDGRFYQHFKTAAVDIDGCIEMLNGPSENHILIISGLYGVLRPSELIQDYSCNIPDEPEIKRLWKQDDLLTNLVIAYMIKHRVKRVFDFMADDSYRHLINWKEIENRTDETFYSRCGKQVGVDMLPELGKAAGLLLSGKTRETLSEIEFGNTVSQTQIAFKREQPDWIPAGVTFSKREICAVWAIRMATNIHNFLSKEKVRLLKNDGKTKSLEWRIDRFKNGARTWANKEKREIADTMHAIRMFRNDMVHEHDDPDAKRIESIKTAYKKVVEWAKRRPWAKGKKYIEPEDVDY